MKLERVAVIGAGVAGLTAARELARSGRDVVVFDKARGAGGRTSTRRGEGTAYDHGAQYFTARTEAFSKQVADWCDRGVAARWTAPVVTLDAGARTATGKNDPRFVGVPGMSALARDLAKDLRLECRTRIEWIDGSASRRILITEDGEELAGFDAVVVATPAPQAVPLLAPVPQLSAAAAGVEMQPCHAALVTFPERLDVDFGGAFVSNSPLAWVARSPSKPGRPDAESWVLHTTPYWSVHHLESPSEEVASALLGAFGEALGRKLPAPSACSTHLWRFARTAVPVGDPFLWDAEQRIGACGDWLIGARVEDAFTSGARLSRAMQREAVLA